MRRRLLVELGVLAALLASLLTIPLPLPHVATATGWLALTAVHVARHRRSYVGLLRAVHSSARSRRLRLAGSTILIGCAAAVVLSGFAQWAGVTAAIPWHGGSSMLLIVLAAAHASRRLWRMRRRHAQIANSGENRRVVTLL
ncbi:MAG: MDM10-complementing protein 1 domain-containing protein [Pseudonocardiaceae bacterium]